MTGHVSAPSRPGQRWWAPPLVVAVVVAALAMVPVLHTRDFYYWDDSAAVFLPTWRAIGTDLLSGTWPTLRPDLWMGGNWAAEAQFGLWNPVNLAVSVFVAAMPDLAVAAAVVKGGFLVLLALGTYALAREYGAHPWPAAALAVALPFGGFTLYYDAATWVAGLMAFAWTPWFWWAARRCARGHLNPIAVYLFGYLLITNGNPYGALAAAVVLAAVALEALAARNTSGLWRLVLVGACVGTTALVAYLPLVLSSEAGWRESGGLSNDGFLVPDLTMLAATSTPSMLPFIRLWSGSGSTVPVAFSAWFLLPVLPWLRWSELRRRGPDLVGPASVLVVYLALALGPSALWMFRWPVRLLEYVFLPVVVVTAVVISAGLRSDRWRVRAALSGATALAGAWLALSANPEILGRHIVAAVLMLVLVGLLTLVVIRAPGFLPALLMAGTGVVLVGQVASTPVNNDVAVWEFPSRIADIQTGAGRFTDPVLQVATPALIPADDRPAAWDDLLFGSLPAAAGIENMASYTGIGYDEFSAILCMNHTGASCVTAFAAAFAPSGDLVPTSRLVDALKANTVVIQNVLAPDVAAALVAGDIPAGWTIGESSDRVTVLERVEALPWQDSRLAATTEGVEVQVTASSDTVERVRVSAPGGGALQFARLAWPGYRATADGAALVVHENAQGLLEVELPAGLDDTEVRVEFRVPGYGIAIPVLLIGLVVAVAQSVLWARARSRRSEATGSPPR